MTKQKEAKQQDIQVILSWKSKPIIEVILFLIAFIIGYVVGKVT